MDKRVKSIVGKAESDDDVLAVLLYGSYARDERNRDIDVCLVLNRRKYDNLFLSQKRLDYLSDSSKDIDVQIFQQIPLYIRQRILREGKILFCRNEEKLYNTVFETIREFEDFEPVYESYLEGVADA